jgi:hypothetical protein
MPPDLPIGPSLAGVFLSRKRGAGEPPGEREKGEQGGGGETPAVCGYLLDEKSASSESPAQERIGQQADMVAGGALPLRLPVERLFLGRTDAQGEEPGEKEAKAGGEVEEVGGGEQEAPPRPEEAGALAQEKGGRLEVLDPLDAGDPVEALFAERQRAVQVAEEKRDLGRGEPGGLKVSRDDAESEGGQLLRQGAAPAGGLQEPPPSRPPPDELQHSPVGDRAGQTFHLASSERKGP